MTEDARRFAEDAHENHSSLVETAFAHTVIATLSKTAFVLRDVHYAAPRLNAEAKALGFTESERIAHFGKFTAQRWSEQGVKPVLLGGALTALYGIGSEKDWEGRGHFLGAIAGEIAAREGAHRLSHYLVEHHKKPLLHWANAAVLKTNKTLGRTLLPRVKARGLPGMVNMVADWGLTLVATPVFGWMGAHIGRRIDTKLADRAGEAQIAYSLQQGEMGPDAPAPPDFGEEPSASFTPPVTRPRPKRYRHRKTYRDNSPSDREIDKYAARRLQNGYAY